MNEAIVICIGNRARGDDGVARSVAQRLEDKLPQGTGLLSIPQLDVVLAEEIARVALAVFVDAEYRVSPPVRSHRIMPDAATLNAHALTPWGLLSLAETLYDGRPEAVLVTVAAPEMGHAEGLSQTAEAASVEAASVVMRIIEERPYSVSSRGPATG